MPPALVGGAGLQGADDAWTASEVVVAAVDDVVVAGAVLVNCCGEFHELCVVSVYGPVNRWNAQGSAAAPYVVYGVPVSD